MAAKKNTKQTLINAFMNEVLLNDKLPSSVYTFCNSLKIDESEFYKHFASFESLEEEIFKLFFENSLNLIQESESYDTYNSRE